jgi:hypothetical protein
MKKLENLSNKEIGIRKGFSHNLYIFSILTNNIIYIISEENIHALFIKISNDTYNTWTKIDQLDVNCFIISLFTAQYVSNVSTSIFRSLRLIVDLFHVLYCSVRIKVLCYGHNTCNLSYVGQTSRSLNIRFQEHIRYIRYNNPQPAYALHNLQNQHEYGQMNSTMTLLKPLNNPNLLLPYEQ